MTVNVFLDTNIWLYMLIQSDKVKYEQSSRLLADESLNIHCSVQVANEISVNLMRKAGKDRAYIQTFLSDLIASYPVLAQEPEDLLTAASLRLDYMLSYWDSLIVASALRANCGTLYSEDMQHGLRIRDNLKIINPFKT